MAINLGTSSVSGLWTTYILKKFVPMLKENYVFPDFCRPAMLPKNAGGYVARWLLPQTFDGSVTALTEVTTVGAIGAAGGEITLTTISSVETTIASYGEWMKVSDLAEETDLPGTLGVYTEQFVDAGTDVIDRLNYTQAKASTNFLHSGDQASAGETLLTTDTATAQDFAAIAGFFHSKNAKGFDSINGDYVWVMHPDQEVDIATHVSTSALSWSDVKKHTPGSDAFGNLVRSHRIVGTLNGVTAMRTTQIVTITEDVAAYQSIALARDGIGWLGLGENGPKAPTIKIKRPGPQDTSQPLDMFMTIGWKIKAASKLLDSNRVLVVYSAV